MSGTAERMFRNVMAEFGINPDDFPDIKLPGPDTPLPPTNATLHILARETGYGTPQRRLIMQCGVSWLTRESTGEHKWFGADETYWHKHVTCARCRELIGFG